MANKTGIEWCDYTINPIIGCTKCSPGCDNCYAEKFAARHAKNPKTAARYSRVITDGKWNGRTDVAFLKCFRGLPVNPKRIFVGSMGDVFHDNIAEIDIQQLFKYMQICHQHTFMLLTKRPERMRHLMALENELREKDDEEGIENRAFQEWPLPNVWLGVTVCNQQEVDEKIPILLSTPAAKRFVSAEPMLGPVDLRGKLMRWTRPDASGSWFSPVPGKVPERLLDWVICGGETGPGARTMNPDWARSLRDQCKATGVPFFFKKMTGKAPIPDDLMIREIPK